MIEPTIPVDEERRLALLRACNIIYTPAEEAFDDVARLAAKMTGSEIALITLVDSDYQWFKARVGVEHVGVPRDLSFCGHCINHRHPLVVDDTREDPRFADNPLVTGDPFIRFYAGVPLLLDEGSSIGALSVADRRPRHLSKRELATLEELARRIAAELRTRAGIAVPRRSDRPDALAVAPGSRIAGRWHVTREIGRGGAGAVFEAKDDGGDRVAIKVLLPQWRDNEEVLERFVREARVLLSLESPHVGRLLDIGNLDVSQGGLPYLALEYLEGTDLQRVLDAKGRVGYRDAVTWCADACDGLAEAHGLGVVHRDLKPSNVFLADVTGAAAPVVKVLDFGIAAGDPTRRDPAKITTVGTVVGSPAYMSPEQMMAASDVDAKSDVWSMGAMLYELLSGQRPFRGENNLQVFANVMTKAPKPFDDATKREVPPAIEEVVFRCLRRPREERFESMAALATALRAGGA